MATTEQSERHVNQPPPLGLVIVGVMLCVVIGYTLIDTHEHNVTHIYRAATDAFRQGDTLYPSGAVIDGFLYLPGFAVMYLPFDWMGPRVGDAIWKITGFALLAYASWSNCRYVERELRIRVLSLALAISIPLLAGNVLNGQANIHLGAACWLAILSAFRRQAAALVFWTGIAILAKPLAVVVVLLIAGLRPRSIPALAGGIGWAIALPFAAADPHYVLGLYQDCWQMFTTMAVSSHFTAADFTALFQTFGWSIEPVQILLIRCTAALATFAVAIVLCARLPRNAAALAVMILAASYMCLFNPRAEGLTYAILALPCATVIALYYYEGHVRPLWVASAVILVLLGCNGLFGALYTLTQPWFKPAFTPPLLILMGIAVAKTWSSDRRTMLLSDTR